MSVDPSGLSYSILAVIHDLTVVAIDCRPFGPGPAKPSDWSTGDETSYLFI